MLHRPIANIQHGGATVCGEVGLALTLADGRRFDLDRQTDDRGRWVFVPAMIPGRAGWTFDQIAQVRAELETPNGHKIVMEAAKARAVPALCLPWAMWWTR